MIAVMDCNLLLVDDEPNIPLSMESALRNEGYQMFLANSASEALEVLNSHSIDIVLSDHRMPGMTGAQLLSQLRESHPSTIRIMLSGEGDMEAVVDAINEGSVYKFLTKPWSNDNLRAIVKEAAVVAQSAKQKPSSAKDGFTTALSSMPRGRVLVLEIRNPSITTFLDEDQMTQLFAQIAGRCKDHAGELLCAITPIEDTLVALGMEVVDRLTMKQLATAMNQPFYLDNKIIPLRLAAGYADKKPEQTSAEWLKNALIALTATSFSGESTAYTETIQHELHERILLERDMRRGLEAGEFFLQLQPQVCGESLEIRGAESLCRWAHPQRGSISPLQFIDLAEQTGFIHELGRYVISETCQVIQLLAQRGINDVKISFNVSPRQLAQPEWTNLVYEFIRENGIDPKLLEVEITESTVMDNPEAAMKVLAQLKEFGVCIALDDFGTGHSSLALLNELPVDVLKFDRALVRNVNEDERSRTLFVRLMEMTHELGLESIAEGVETAAQVELCQSLGCRLIQGFAFYQPLAVGEFLQLLDRRAGHRH